MVIAIHAFNNILVETGCWVEHVLLLLNITSHYPSNSFNFLKLHLYVALKFKVFWILYFGLNFTFLIPLQFGGN